MSGANDHTLGFRMITLTVVAKTRINPVLIVLYFDCTCGTLGTTVVTSNATVVRNSIRHKALRTLLVEMSGSSFF